MNYQIVTYEQQLLSFNYEYDDNKLYNSLSDKEYKNIKKHA